MGFTLKNQYEAKIIYAVIAIIAFVEGLQVLARLAYQYYFKDDLHLSPSQVSFILGIIYIPWCIKPLFAYIVDTYRFLGYRRKSYLVVWAFIESLLWLILGHESVKSPYTVVSILFWLKVAVCFSNVIGCILLSVSLEALVVEISKAQQEIFRQTLSESQQLNAKNEEDSGNVSLFMSLKMIGIIISSYFGGLLLEYYHKKKIFTMTAVIPLIVFFVGFALPEQKIVVLDPSTIFKPQTDEEKQSLINNGNNVDANQQQQNQDQKDFEKQQEQIKQELENEKKTFSKFMNFVKQKEILLPVIFLFLFSAAPSSEGVMFFFFTNHLHFSALFMGQIKVISTLGNLIAIYIFHKFLRNIEFKTIFFYSAILAVIVYESQIILLERYNLQLGIPDKAFALFDSFVIHLLKEINLLPILVLGCKICPKNIEATMYAFITTVINLGSLISLQFESVLAYYLQITSYNFKNLTTLVIICGLSHLVIALFVYQVEFNDKLSEEQLEQIANKGLTDSQIVKQ